MDSSVSSNDDVCGCELKVVADSDEDTKLEAEISPVSVGVISDWWYDPPNVVLSLLPGSVPRFWVTSPVKVVSILVFDSITESETDRSTISSVEEEIELDVSAPVVETVAAVIDSTGDEVEESSPIEDTVDEYCEDVTDSEREKLSDSEVTADEDDENSDDGLVVTVDSSFILKWGLEFWNEWIELSVVVPIELTEPLGVFSVSESPTTDEMEVGSDDDDDDGDTSNVSVSEAERDILDDVV